MTGRIINSNRWRPRGRMCTCAHQGCALAQSLPNCWSYCPDHPWTASNQWENCEEQPRCTPHTGHYWCLATIEHGCNSRKTTREMDTCTVRTSWRGGIWTNSICHPGGQFEWAMVSGWSPQPTLLPFVRGHDIVARMTVGLTFHVLSWAFSVFRISRLWNSHPWHQIWLQSDMSGMKWTVVWSTTITHLAHCQNWEKLSVRCCRTSHRPSW